jgi:ribosomal-protein-alanine N-acetyltransferase
MKVLETSRLIVRHFRADDLDDLYSICRDEELMRYVGDGKPLSMEQVERWIEKSQDNYRNLGFGCFAVTEKAGGKFAGYCGLVRGSEGDEVEIIYALKKEYWGSGLATEVARAMIAYGLDELKLNQIVATIDPDNASSIRIVEKLGMTFQQRRVDQHGLPELVYVISRERPNEPT